MITKHGKRIQVGFNGNVGYNSEHQFLQTHCTVRDITEINIANQKLKDSEYKYRQLVNLMPLGLVVHEIILDSYGKPGDYRFLSVNDKYCEQIGKTADEVVGKTLLEIFPNIEKYWIEVFGQVALTGVPIVYENYAEEIGKYFKVSAYSPEYKHFAVITEDITKEKKKQEEIMYLSNHDFLSGLYNRRYFVDEFAKLDNPEYYPLGIMMIDINGLKIINDAFGHNVGDVALTKIAEVCSNSFRPQDIISRIGGDEFAIILPNTSAEEIEKIKLKLRALLNKVTIENVVLSVATGYEVKTELSDTGLDDLLKQAENHMYRHKLTEGISTRNHAIKAILKTLTEKSPFLTKSS